MEYALVTIAVLAVVLCFGAILDAVSDGALGGRIASSLSRRVPQGIQDILAF